MTGLEVLRVGLVQLQACCPKCWTNNKIEESANIQHPTGVHSDWQVQKENCPNGDAPKVTCADDATRQHVMLTC